MLRTGLSERTITDLQTMMHNSATDGWASAARVTPDNTHPGIGGKTGSAEWTENQDAPHAWYFGFYPTEEPRVSVALVVERGGLGPTVAARVAKRIFSSSALERYVQGVSE
jgi:cell division protein FtsI/penicillin-binding protein 2